MGWSWDLMGGNGGRFHGEVVIFFCGNRDDMEDFIGNYSKEMVMNREMVMKQRISWEFQEFIGISRSDMGAFENVVTTTFHPSTGQIYNVRIKLAISWGIVAYITIASPLYPIVNI